MKRFLSKRLEAVLVVYFCSLFVSISADCFWDEESEIPVALQYNGDLISSKCMEELLFDVNASGIDIVKKEINLVDFYTKLQKYDESQCDDENDDWFSDNNNFDWHYCGVLHNDLHVICGYEYMQRNSWVTIAIVKREGDILTRLSAIAGQDYSIKVAEGTIQYAYYVSERAFLNIVTELYPEIASLYKRSSKNGLGDGVAGFYGFMTHKVFVSGDGVMHSDEVVSFELAEGGWDSGKILMKEELKDFALGMLKDVDAKIPDALKEDGVAYSPHCFRLLVEDDVKSGDISPCMVSLSEHKNDEYVSCYYDHFYWEYIGQYRNYYCIYVCFNDYSYKKNVFEGIYTIEKQGDYLKKVARLMRDSGRENTIGNDYNQYGIIFGADDQKIISLQQNKIFYEQSLLVGNCVDAFMEQQLLPANIKGIKNMELDCCENDICGDCKYVLEIADDGMLKSKQLIGFCPSQKTLPENIDGIHQGVLSFNQALHYHTGAFCEQYISSDPVNRYLNWDYCIDYDSLKKLLENVIVSTKNNNIIDVKMTHIDNQATIYQNFVYSVCE